MSAPDEKSYTPSRINAEVKGEGKQFVTDGSGDQNVASNNAVIVHGQQWNSKFYELLTFCIYSSLTSLP